jgi:excisionase family DNA binding protein
MSNSSDATGAADPITAALEAAGADPAAVVFTVPEVATVLRCSRGVAYAAVRSGEIPSVKVGRCIRIPRQALAAMMSPNASPA